MRPAMLIICAALLAASCSGDSDADTTTTPDTAPTTTPDTTAAPTTAPVTTPPATTEPPTTTSTTAATTTTTNPPAQDLDDVEAAYRDAWTKLFAARQDPTNDALYQAALDATTGERTDLVRTQLDSFRDAGRAVRPGDDRLASLTLESAPELIAEGVAEFQVCEIDDWKIVLVGGGPDGTDAILRDAPYAFRMNVTMNRTAAGWKVASVTEIQAWPGELQCGD